MATVSITLDLRLLHEVQARATRLRLCAEAEGEAELSFSELVSAARSWSGPAGLRFVPAAEVVAVVAVVLYDLVTGSAEPAYSPK